MARQSWVYIDGVAYDKAGYVPSRGETQSHTFIPDIQPFRSPVDGTMITGRASLREHNLRNNVVQTEELKGLPMKQSSGEYQLSKQEVRDRREYITHLYDKSKLKG